MTTELKFRLCCMIVGPLTYFGLGTAMYIYEKYKGGKK